MSIVLGGFSVYIAANEGGFFQIFGDARLLTVLIIALIQGGWLTYHAWISSPSTSHPVESASTVPGPNDWKKDYQQAVESVFQLQTFLIEMSHGAVRRRLIKSRNAIYGGDIGGGQAFATEALELAPASGSARNAAAANAFLAVCQSLLRQPSAAPQSFSFAFPFPQENDDVAWMLWKRALICVNNDMRGLFLIARAMEKAGLYADVADIYQQLWQQRDRMPGDVREALSTAMEELQQYAVGS